MIRVYVEMPGEDKEDIQLNVVQGKVEIKGKNFYKTVDLPEGHIDVERASSRYKNGVLQVSIPKKDQAKEKDTSRIHLQ